MYRIKADTPRGPRFLGPRANVTRDGTGGDHWRPHPAAAYEFPRYHQADRLARTAAATTAAPVRVERA